MIRKLASTLLSLVLTALVLVFATPSLAAGGTFRLKSPESNEVSGAWRIFVKIELPRPPATAHQSIRFVFTKTAVYERALIDGKPEPVVNRLTLQGQNPIVESLDVAFSDPTGKIYRGTNFDFGLKRERGFEAGEYKVLIRTSDGTDIGGSASLTLKGNNPVIDRRSIAFNAKDTSIKKYNDGLDAGAKVARNDEEVAPTTMQGDVQPTGTPPPFVSQDAFNRTAEEDIKLQKPSGCGCSVPGMGSMGDRDLFVALPLIALGMLAAGRLSRRKDSERQG